MCKENRSTGKIVIVSTVKGDRQKLPENVQSAFAAGGNTWPIVVMTDPAMSKVYATYPYAKLKPQDYRSIFRDGRRAHGKDADADILPAPGEAAPDKPADDDATAVADDDEMGDFEPSGFESWRSTAGSVIEARLVAVDSKGNFVFETRAGKRIPVGPDKLDLASREKAKAVIKGE